MALDTLDPLPPSRSRAEPVLRTTSPLLSLLSQTRAGLSPSLSPSSHSSAPTPMLAHANNAPQPPPRACGIPGRRPLPPPPHVALPTLDLHAWADGWSLSSTTRAPAGAPVQHDDLVSPTSLAPAPPPPSASSQSFNAGSRAGSVAPPLGTAARSALPSSSSSSFPQCDKPLVPTGALEGFDLDGGRPRCAGALNPPAPPTLSSTPFPHTDTRMSLRDALLQQVVVTRCTTA